MAFTRRRSVTLSGDMAAALNDALHPVLEEPDIAANMRMVDLVNAETDAERLGEVVRQIRKIIQSKNYKHVLLGLSLVEMLVMNCGRPLHKAVADQKFLASMSKLIKESQKKGTRDATLANEKALDLIQAWGEAFLTERDPALRRFVETYHGLRAKRVIFPRPQMDPTAVPVLSPPAGGGAGGARSGGGAPPAASAGDAPSGAAGNPLESVGPVLASLPDIGGSASVAQNALGVLVPMLLDVKSSAEVASNEMISEMVGVLRSAEPRVLELINTTMATSPEALEPLLSLNDALHTVLQEYEHIRTYGPRPKPAPVPKAAASPPVAVAAPVATAVVDDDPFGFGAPVASTAPAAASSAAPVASAAPAAAASSGGGAIARPVLAARPPKPPSAAVPALAPPPSDATPKRRTSRARSGQSPAGSDGGSAADGDLLAMFGSPGTTSSPASSGTPPAPAGSATTAQSTGGATVFGLPASGGADPAGSHASPGASPADDPFAAIASRRSSRTASFDGNGHAPAAARDAPVADPFASAPAPARDGPVVDPFASVPAPTAPPTAAPSSQFVSAPAAPHDPFAGPPARASAGSNPFAGPSTNPFDAPPAPAGGGVASHNPFEGPPAPAASTNPFDMVGVSAAVPAVSAPPAAVSAAATTAAPRTAEPLNPEDPFAGIGGF